VTNLCIFDTGMRMQVAFHPISLVSTQCLPRTKYQLFIYTNLRAVEREVNWLSWMKCSSSGGMELVYSFSHCLLPYLRALVLYQNGQDW